MHTDVRAVRMLMLRSEESQPTLKGGELPTGTDVFVAIAGTDLNVLKIKSINDRPRHPFTKSTKNVVLMDGALLDLLHGAPVLPAWLFETLTEGFSLIRIRQNQFKQCNDYLRPAADSPYRLLRVPLLWPQKQGPKYKGDFLLESDYVMVITPKGAQLSVPNFLTLGKQQRDELAGVLGGFLPVTIVSWFLDRFQPTLEGPRYVVISKDHKQACKLALMAATEDKATKAKVTLIVPESDRDFDSRLNTHAKDYQGYREKFDSIDHSHDQSLMSRAIPLWIYDQGMHHEDRDIPASVTQPGEQPVRTTANPANVAEIPEDENPSPPPRSGSKSSLGTHGSRSPSTSQERSRSRRSLHGDFDDAKEERDHRPRQKKHREQKRKHKETETDEEEGEHLDRQDLPTDQEDADEDPDAGHVSKKSKKKRKRHEADEEETERRTTPRKGRVPARFDAVAEEHHKPRGASPRAKGPTPTPPSGQSKIGSKLGTRLRRGLGK